MRACFLALIVSSQAACGGSSASTPPPADSGSPPVDGATEAGAIGSPCVPLAEGLPTFDGFIVQEVNLGPQSSTTASGYSTCLVNHFQGRVTCPYGQDAQGHAPAGASPCKTPDGQAVVGAVRPWCADRPASKTVTWSCRCANAQGNTNDGYSYCVCPSSTTCTQLVPLTGASENDISGAYCVPVGVPYDPQGSCLVSCDPATHPCP